MIAADVQRALTVKQPWADLIMAGIKDVENRSWPVPSTLPQWFRCTPCGATEIRDRGANALHDCSPEGTWWRTGPFPFRLGIHAAAKPDRSDIARDAWLQSCPAYSDPLTLGALLGFVTVTGCHQANQLDRCLPPPREMCGSLDTDGAGPCVLSPPIGDGSAHVHYGAEDVGLDPCSSWAEDGAWHWTLTDPEPLDQPIPMTGMLGLWRLPTEVAA